jgi:hypothetical protein
MPTPDDHAQIPDMFTADFTVVRPLLSTSRIYQNAVKTFVPYNEIHERNEGARTWMVEIVNGVKERKLPSLVSVNNRLEANAPGTIEAVVVEL